MNKSRDRLDLARQIRAAGCPVYIAEDDGEANSIPADNLIVYQVGGLLESSAFEYCGGTGITIQIVVTVHAPTFVISGFDVELPWATIGFSWLETDGISTVYRFSGMPHEFERKHVLNHRADVTRTLRRGQSIKGYLLGNDLAPIPDEVRNGSLFPATVIIWDQYGRQYRAPVDLTATRRQKYFCRPSRRGGLFDRRDPDPKPRVTHTQFL